MGHTFSNLLTHIIFSTKARRNYLYKNMREPLFAYMTGIINSQGGKAFKINGIENHVHVLLSVKPDAAISNLVRVLKANSSKWIHESYPDMHDFQWQSGFSCFSVSKSVFPSVRKYINEQEKHHRRIPFERELKVFLEKHGIAFDLEHYLD